MGFSLDSQVTSLPTLWEGKGEKRVWGGGILINARLILGKAAWPTEKLWAH